MLKEQRLNFLDSFYESNTKANIVGYAIGTQIANAQSNHYIKLINQAINIYESTHKNIIKYSSFKLKKNVKIKKGKSNVIRDEYYYKDKLVMTRCGFKYWYDSSVINNEDSMYYRVCNVIKVLCADSQFSAIVYHKEFAWAKNIIKQNKQK